MKFHIERWSAVIAGVAGFLLINQADFGMCAELGDSSICQVGETVVSNSTTLFLVYTPLIFGPVFYVIAGALPKWSAPPNVASQLLVIMSGLSMIGSGVAVHSWGAATAALIAYLVGGTGVYLGYRWWRAERVSAADL